MATTMENNEKMILNGSCLESFSDYDEFMAGIRVLVVDDDRTCLLILETMMRKLLYQVTTCHRAKDALSMLREDRNRFDIIISNLHMPEMDGFSLLQILHLESIDLPVVMMSAEDGKDFVLEGIIQGACDYLVKPVSIERIKLIWQHVVRKKQIGLKELHQSTRLEDAAPQLNQSRNADNVSLKNKGKNQPSKRRKNDVQEGEVFDDVITMKRPRVSWTQELHLKFLTAVNQLGHDKVAPKKILERLKEMNVSGLTRENVSSHLQKYRLYLQRLNESPHEIGQSRAYMETYKSNFQHPSSLDSTSCKVAVPNLAIPEATRFNFRGVGMSSVDRRTLLDSRIPESSFYPVTGFSGHDYAVSTSAVAMAPYTDSFSQTKEYEYMYEGDTYQHSKNITMSEFKTENMCDFISDQHELHVKYLDDQEETLHGPFVW